MPVVNFIVARRGFGETARVETVPDLPGDGQVVTVDGMICQVRKVSLIPGGSPYDAVVICNELET